MPPVPLRTLAPYAIAALLILLLGGRWLAGHHGAGAPAASDAAGGAGAPENGAAPAVRITTGAASSLVDVAGAVRRPGVYRLRAGARVGDALSRAGGPTRRADTTAVNLAAKLVDGQQIVVPLRVAVAAGAAAQQPAGGAGAPQAGPPVSLNGATLEQLDALQGVGPATAQKILDWRSRNGGFRSVDDLAEIPGIGPKKLEALRPQVTP